MKIAVIGCGYLGAVHAAAMASLGYETVGVDVDEAKIERLRRGEPPFYEPGLPELLRAASTRAPCASRPMSPRPPGATSSSSPSARRSAPAPTRPTSRTSTPRSSRCCRT